MLEQAIETVSALPDDVQDEFARILLDQPPIQLTAEEDADLAEADAEILRGEFATDEEIAAIWAKHGR